MSAPRTPSPASGGIALRLVAVALAVAAVFQPYWTYSATVGSGIRFATDFYGDRVVGTTYNADGSLRDQRVLYYSNPTFDAPHVAAVMGNENWLVIALAALAGLATVLALPPLRVARLRPLAILFDVLLLVVAVGAPAYLAATIGPAANADLSSSISGFTGSSTSGGGFVGEAWGPALGWFLVVGASIAAFLGLAVGRRPASATRPVVRSP